MKREDILKILGEDADKDKVTALLDAMHGEIKIHKDSADGAGKALAEKVKELEAVAASASNAGELQAKLKELQEKYEADTKAAAQKLADMEFGTLVDGAIREAKGRNIKAIRALLPLDELKASKNQQPDIAAAVKALAEGEDAYQFGTQEPAPTGAKVDVGAKIGSSFGAEPQFTMEQVRSMTPGDINKHWAQVQETLKKGT